MIITILYLCIYNRCGFSLFHNSRSRKGSKKRGLYIRKDTKTAVMMLLEKLANTKQLTSGGAGTSFDMQTVV